MAVSENNFAICFLLEISLIGFPFQMNFYYEYRVPNNYKSYFSKDFISKGNRLMGISSRKHIANILSSCRNPVLQLPVSTVSSHKFDSYNFNLSVSDPISKCTCQTDVAPAFQLKHCLPPCRCCDTPR